MDKTNSFINAAFECALHEVITQRFIKPLWALFSCYMKAPQMGGLKTEKYSFSVPETRGLKVSASLVPSEGREGKLCFSLLAGRQLSPPQVPSHGFPSAHESLSKFPFFIRINDLLLTYLSTSTMTLFPDEVPLWGTECEDFNMWILMGHNPADIQLVAKIKYSDPN